MVIAATVVTKNGTSPYVVALIGVLGAVVGASISALTQGIAAKSTSRAQATALQLQLDHQTQEAVRQQRFRVYSEF